jgi:hypothetical protein
MDFIRSISNGQTPILDDDLDRLLDEIAADEQLDEKTALDRIADRVEIRNIALWRPIVGVENLMLTKRFLELSKEGKPVSSTILKGFMPAVEMLDEIVTAGPSYVQVLKALHKRAKKGR